MLIGLAAYIVKTYGLPIMQEQWKAVQVYFKGLRSSHRSLTKEKRVIQNAIVSDREWQRSLREKVQLWQERVRSQRETMIAEREHRKQLLQVRMKEQGQQIELYRMYKQVAPEAINDARSQLEKKFAHDDAQRLFIESVITALHKK